MEYVARFMWKDRVCSMTIKVPDDQGKLLNANRTVIYRATGDCQTELIWRFLKHLGFELPATIPYMKTTARLKRFGITVTSRNGDSDFCVKLQRASLGRY